MIIENKKYQLSSITSKKLSSLILVHDLTYITDRSDWNRKIANWKYYQVSGWYMCPENSYARQFKVRIEDDGSADDTALNSVRMKCFDNNNDEIT